MSRRRPSSRPLRLESLEVRCNPAALVPMADYVAEPAPAQAGTHYFDGRFLRADDLRREQASAGSNTNNYFTDDYSLTVGDSSGANLNAFAGQTVRLRIATTNNRGLLIVGVDDANIQARASTGGGISDLVVDPRSRDTVHLGGAALGDTITHEVGHWIGPAAANNGGISKLGSKLLVIQGDGTYDTNDNNGRGTHVAGTIPAEVNHGVRVSGSTIAGTTGTFTLTFNGQTSTFSRPDLESLLDDLARDVAGATATSGRAFAVLTVGGTTSLY